MIYGTEDFTSLLISMIKDEKKHDLYKETVECYEKMEVHIYGKTPVEILSRVRPREPLEVKAYRLENYEPTTKSTAAQALSIVSKIFNPWLSEIKWKNQTPNGKRLQDYTLEYYPGTNSVIKYIAEAGMKRMIADANGIMAIRPNNLPGNELEYVNPIVVLYGSKAIWWRDDECYIIHIKEEDDKKGAIHHFSYYDKNFVVDFTAQIINSKDLSITEKFVYSHQFNELPAWPLQGEIETNDEGLSYYVSYFEAALPFWNLAITHDSDLFGSYISHLFPQKIEVTEECAFVYEDQRCSLGKITFPDGKIKTCPGCNGTGYKRASGVYGVHQVSSDKLKGNSLGGMVPVQYVTVPVEPTKMLEERVEKLRAQGLEALNMDIVNKVGENQSGIAKVIDRGELYDFLHKIASVVYDTHITNVYYFFNKYMFGVQDSNPNRKLDANLPEINKPAKFDISSTSEMTVEYREAKDAEVNPEYLRQKQIAIVSKEFANNPDLKRKITLTIELDPLPGLTVEEAESLMSTGTVSKRDAVLHFQMGKFINQALIEDPQFYNLDMEDKIKKLYTYADAFISENRITLDTSAIDNSFANADA